MESFLNVVGFSLPRLWHFDWVWFPVSQLPASKTNHAHPHIRVLVLHNNPQISWERTKIAIALLFTLPGAPSIYYGDEAGIAGRLDTNEGFRYPMPWSREFQKEAPFLFYQRLARLKREEKAFQEGGFRILWAEGKIFSFVRCYKEQVYFIVTSVETEEKTITLPVEAYGIESGGMPQDIFGSKLQYKKMERDLEILVEPDCVYIFTMQ